MKIKIADFAGTCFGVNNAIKIAFEAAKRHDIDRIFILGELVHNPFVVKNLEKEGVIRIDDYKILKEGDVVLIRAHGELKEVYDFCEKNNIIIIDCTCPFVKKAQSTAELLEEKGYNVVIIGDPEHPEVRSIVARLKKAVVIQNLEDIDYYNIKKGKIGVLSQTTQTLENFSKIIAKIVSYSRIIKIHNTICTATEERQTAAKKLSESSDLMIVIGGKNSSNTHKLYQLCSEITKSYWVVDDSEIKKEWFSDSENIGITAGASTPKEIIDAVVEKIKGWQINKSNLIDKHLSA